MRPILLTVAGFDPTGGAGASLDLAIFHSRGFRGAAVLTALTAQDTRAVRAVRPVPAAFIRRQWDVLRADLPLAGVKVGMAGSAAAWDEIGRGLSLHRAVPRVADPILRASSGAVLGGNASSSRIVAALRGRLTILTPNLDEARALSGRRVGTPREMAEAARRIAGLLECACLVKGGHLDGAPVDVLFDGGSVRRFRRSRRSRDAHGTGCFLSASILCGLAEGEDLASACESAGRRTGLAIRDAARPGGGRCLLLP